MTYIAEALRRLVATRAERRCEYCQLREAHSYFPHEIDHIFAEKHGGETLEPNLCYACSDCNRYKGSDLCSLDLDTGQIVALFHPRREKWGDHFQLENNGIIRPLTANGRVTVRLLRMNELEITEERRRLIALGEY